MNNAHEYFEYHHFHNSSSESVSKGIIVEKSVSLSVNGDFWLSFLCTPTRLDALAIGFLYNEGIINNLNDVEDIQVCKNEDNIDAWLSKAVSAPTTWKRTTGCTGGFTSLEIKTDHYDIHGELNHQSPENIRKMLRQLINAQVLYRESGGVHSSALSNGEELLLLAEDVGRHNTLDKLAGLYVMDGITPENHIILTTGRISSEMLQKSARIGASMVISRTSPTSMSIQLAEEMGITLIGYARGDQFNIYSHPERIKVTNSSSCS